MSKGKQIVHNLDDADLLKIATEQKEQVVMDKLSDAVKFIYNLNIKQGDALISAQLVYYTYRQWKGWNNKRQPKMQFFRDFAKNFESKRTKDGIHYLLNPKPFDLSKEVYWIMRSEVRRDKARKQKK